MQRKTKEFSILRSPAIGVSFLGAVLLIVGCAKNSPEGVTNNGKEGTVDSKPATPEPSIEEKLVKRRMEVYSKMAEIHEQATDAAQREQQKPALKALNLQLEELTNEEKDRPAEAMLAARTAVKEQWEQTMLRLRNAQGKLKLKGKEREAK